MKKTALLIVAVAMLFGCDEAKQNRVDMTILTEQIHRADSLQLVVDEIEAERARLSAENIAWKKFIVTTACDKCSDEFLSMENESWK